MAGPTPKELKEKIDELQISLDLEQQQVKDALDAKDAAIAEKDAAIAERDAAIVEKDAVIEQRDATIVSLNAIIATLEGQVADGGTPEERQALLDQIVALKADVEGTVAP
jgi:uncharacterized protein (DUF3084 family)